MTDFYRYIQKVSELASDELGQEAMLDLGNGGLIESKHCVGCDKERCVNGKGLCVCCDSDPRYGQGLKLSDRIHSLAYLNEFTYYGID